MKRQSHRNTRNKKEWQLWTALCECSSLHIWQLEFVTKNCRGQIKVHFRATNNLRAAFGMGANTSRESSSTRFQNGSAPQIEEAQELSPCLRSPTTNSSFFYAKKVRKHFIQLKLAVKQFATYCLKIRNHFLYKPYNVGWKLELKVVE